ncbi:hypothetical protein M0208_11565 [Sphingomonas sp. SUN019]|uniref:hypothetical protein n=1 Tax=Sphingomonas sp. SUN019 TaxID=2937788 RepID=UPI002164A3AE|nr:hypothetical protein [Sphingomonas sp. SUN019]UVO51127.1 hypothetical protein M0208_11565 [Sphingomonas sp. SUN019]
MPRMLGEIVEQMLGERDTIVVGRCAPGEDVLAAARRSKAELLVLQSRSGVDTTIDNIFADPALSVLLISDDGRNGSLVRLKPERVTLDRDSIGRLARAAAERH